MTDTDFELGLGTLQKFCIKHNIILDEFPVVNSTNDYIKQFAGQQQLRVCVADMQSSGRGCLGKEWASPAGSGIYISMLLPQYTNNPGVPISLVAALAEVNLLREFLQPYVNVKPLKVKWPNDVMYNAQKLSGILLELLPVADGKFDLVIGCGINVNTRREDIHDVGQDWTSMWRVAGLEFDREVIMTKLVKSIHEYANRLRCNGFEDFMDEWHEVDFLAGRNFYFDDHGTSKFVTGCGIDANGRIKVMDATGEQVAYSSGKVVFG